MPFVSKLYLKIKVRFLKLIYGIYYMTWVFIICPGYLLNHLDIYYIPEHLLNHLDIYYIPEYLLKHLDIY